MATKHKGLGRGLDALLSGNQNEPEAPRAPDSPQALPPDRLQPGKYQPRTRMDHASPAELADQAKPPQIDVVYLNSFDFNPDDPFSCAMHHVKELIAVRPCLRKGSVIAIDDNIFLPDGQITGKGFLAMQWFDHLNIPCKHRGYQMVWQL